MGIKEGRFRRAIQSSNMSGTFENPIILDDESNDDLISVTSVERPVLTGTASNPIIIVDDSPVEPHQWWNEPYSLGGTFP